MLFRNPAGGARLPGGPTAFPTIGRQIAFLRDPLNFLTRAHRTYGDLVSLPLNGRTTVAVFGAREVETVTSSYGKEVEISMLGGLDLDMLKGSLQGRGPLNTTGAAHASYRLICLRALSGESGRSYAAITAELTERLLESWRVGTEVDLLPTMGALTRRVFKYYMFGSDIEETDPELNGVVDLYVSTLDSPRHRLGSSLVPYDIPGVSRATTLRRGLSLVDARVLALADGSTRSDRYSLAEAMMRELANAGLDRDPALARELMLQLYFAGLTSVASTIVWTFLLLARHPSENESLLAELCGELSGRVPEPRDARRLPTLDRVLDESMRLYPGAAYEFRKTETELVIGDYRLPAGVPLLLAPWVTQRSHGSFEDPDSFRPQRFSGEGESYRKGAFAPWGTGSRSCIGKVLARTALRTVVGGVTQRYRLDLVPNQRIDAHAARFGIRLLPRPGVRVSLAHLH